MEARSPLFVVTTANGGKMTWTFGTVRCPDIDQGWVGRPGLGGEERRVRSADV